MSTHAEWTNVQNLTVAVLPEHEVPDAWLNGDAPSTCILTGGDGENPDDCTTHAHEDKAPVLALEDAGNCLAFLVRGDRRQLTALADQITSAVKAFWDPQ